MPHVQLESGLWPGSFSFRFQRMCIGLFVAGGSVAKPCNTMQYQYTGMGQCKCPQGGNRLLMDKKRLRHRKRERESDAFAILQLLSYHVSLCLFCSVKAQLNEAHAVLSCPTQRLGPQVVHSYYQLKPAYWVIRSLKHTANCKPYLESLKGERRHRE